MSRADLVPAGSGPTGARELVVLGTASQAPTRHRAQNGYVLRWDDEAILFDPGEGTQRQLQLAGVSPTAITRICITHFHGDHCLGLPGMIQRLSLDGVTRAIDVCYPAQGQAYFDRLHHASAFHETARLRPRPVAHDGVVLEAPGFTLSARALVHAVPTVGWRLEEPEGRRMLPERLAAAGVEGPAVGRLQAEGDIDVDGRRVTLDEVSAPRPGQKVAFVMDTELCDAAFALAEGVDLLICESTYLCTDVRPRAGTLHLAAAEAAQIAKEAGAGLLVLTHYSARHSDERAFEDEAREIFPNTVAARDLTRIAVPKRRSG